MKQQTSTVYFKQRLHLQLWQGLHALTRHRLSFCLLFFFTTTICSFPQGSVIFQNSVFFQTVDPTGGGRLVYDVGSPLNPAGGARLAGTQWVAELYAGTEEASLAPLPASISRFRTSTTTSKGKWASTGVYGPNDHVPLPYPVGTTVTLMVKVWDFSEFPTYEEAATGHGLTGASEPFSYVIPPNDAATTAFYMEGLRAFALGMPLVGCVRGRAQATAQVASGTVVGALVTDSGCGYTNAPTVVIQGGGGTGATATAVVSNTQVIAINITGAGCCYTNTPSVIIGSPWFRPTVSIGVVRVKITEHVVLGREYVLESSFNTLEWTATGPPFIAQSETIENEFDVGTTGGFFRVREVP